MNESPVRFSFDAMATRFELRMCGGDPRRLRSAGEEARAEIERLDRQLSAYSASSELSWINAHAVNEPVKVEPRLFGLLRLCAEISDRMLGAFDITIAPLMLAWREAGGPPAPGAREAAAATVGMHLVDLDSENRTVRFLRPGVRLDLGAVGKGYAVDMAVEILRDQGVSSALLHGGTSTITAIGVPPESCGWRVALGPAPDAEVVSLRDESLSVSASRGRFFDGEGGGFGHVLDPATGVPVPAAAGVAVIGPEATLCDALSTAALVIGPDGVSRIAEGFPGYRAVWLPSE